MRNRCSSKKGETRWRAAGTGGSTWALPQTPAETQQKHKSLAFVLPTCSPALLVLLALLSLSALPAQAARSQHLLSPRSSITQWV